LGTAYVAAMGTGMFASWNDIARFISQGPTYYPQSAVVPRYRKGFELYRELYSRLQSYLPELGQLESMRERDEGDRKGPHPSTPPPPPLP